MKFLEGIQNPEKLVNLDERNSWLPILVTELIFVIIVFIMYILGMLK
jgi:hypothetical protein